MLFCLFLDIFCAKRQNPCKILFYKCNSRFPFARKSVLRSERSTENGAQLEKLSLMILAFSAENFNQNNLNIVPVISSKSCKNYSVLINRNPIYLKNVTKFQLNCQFTKKTRITSEIFNENLRNYSSSRYILTQFTKMINFAFCNNNKNQ